MRLFWPNLGQIFEIKVQIHEIKSQNSRKKSLFFNTESYLKKSFFKVKKIKFDFLSPKT